MREGGFDWAGLLRAGLRAGLLPAQVWTLTPWELALLTGRSGAQATLGRTGLEALMRAFPDDPVPHDGMPDDHGPDDRMPHDHRPHDRMDHGPTDERMEGQDDGD
ncbi:rcc01693 family protein [Haematobacter sp.]|uniref:rcc01693 family protein n=1 Tax=Haematobacter sp. TaxID=2953762 RepID=UPI0028A73782|nr:rcc01693 family protein [Haematobacter sp.]